MTSTRTDAHSPKNLVTEDYSYLVAYDTEAPNLGRNEYIMGLRRQITGERKDHRCHHCGVWIRYVALLRHNPTGEIIAIGETCLQNRFDQATEDFHAARKAAELDRAAHRIVTAGNAFLETVSPEARALLTKTGDALGRDIGFVSDVRRKLWIYGELFPKQVAVVERIAKEEAEKAAEAAAPKPEVPAVVRIEAPLGRMVVTGTVRSTRWYEGDYGSTLKMTVDVVTPDGEYTLWGSVPTNSGVAKGDVVTFTATVEASRGDDPTFAVFKRPTKLTIKES